MLELLLTKANIICFIVLIVTFTLGKVIRRYTKKRLDAIDGMSEIHIGDPDETNSYYVG